MKNLILLSLVFFLSKNSFSQSFEPNFLGEDFLHYKGVQLILNDDVSSNFSFAFYSDLSYCQSSSNSNVIYPSSSFSFKTEKDSLKNRIFLVDKIINKDGNNWDSKSASFRDRPIFVLKDSKTNKLIYYIYDPKYEHKFPFNTSKINYNKEAFCSKIERNVDDFTGKIKINSPMSSDYEISPMIIYKYINNGKTTYTLYLRANGSTLNVGESGVIILFEDGSKWTSQTKIDVDAASYGYNYNAYINLTSNDLSKFLDKKIDKYRLYIYDEEVDSSEAEKFKIYVKCVKEKV